MISDLLPDPKFQSNRQLGMIGSSLEHLVLEQLFAKNNEQGFSAIKAIQLAAEQGQRIYTITKDNYQKIMPQLQLATAAKADIQSAAQAGYTVTTHERRISLNGYTGEGYIILNDRGTGAWMINGGLYGGSLALVLLSLLTMSLVPLAGPFLSIHLVFVSLGLVSAGLALINGNRQACYVIMFATLHLFKEAFLNISIARLFKKFPFFLSVISFFGVPARLFGVNRLAKQLCQCDIEPKCGL